MVQSLKSVCGNQLQNTFCTALYGSVVKGGRVLNYFHFWIGKYLSKMDILVIIIAHRFHLAALLKSVINAHYKVVQMTYIEIF